MAIHLDDHHTAFTVPQLYPYTLSEDDIWAEEKVANILAVRASSFRPAPSPVQCPCVHPGLLPLGSARS
jgi:hypothetical protein